MAELLDFLRDDGHDFFNDISGSDLDINDIKGRYKFDDNPAFKGYQLKTQPDGSLALDFNGETIDTAKIREKYNGTIKGGKLTLDFEGIMRDMKVDESVIKDNAQKIKDIEDKWNNSTGVQNMNEGINAQETGREFERKGIKDPTNQAEFEAVMKKYFARNQKAFDDLKNELEEAKKGDKDSMGKKFGKFVKTALYLGLGLSLYDAVKAHQNAMNGCWIFNPNSSKNKCKVSQLTCDSDSKQTTSGDYTLCSLCDDQTKCYNDDPLSYNPCPLDSKSQDDKKKFPGSPGTDANCVKISDGTTSGYQMDCPSDNGDSPCSSYCSPDKIKLGPGSSIQCINVSFLGAFQDFSQHTLETGKDFLTQVFDILKMITYIIIIGFALFIIIKIISFIMSEVESSGGESSRKESSRKESSRKKNK
jgi:hypothetical protein